MCDDCNFLMDLDLLTDETPSVRDSIGYHADKVLGTLADSHGEETGIKHRAIPLAELPRVVVEKLPGVFGVCTYMEGDDLEEERMYDGTVASMLAENEIEVGDLLLPV